MSAVNKTRDDYAGTIKPASMSRLIFTFSLVVLVFYMLFNMLVAGYFVVYPLVNRSASDFAQLLIENRQRWEKSTDSERKKLANYLRDTYDIEFSAESNQADHTLSRVSFLPYIYLLEKELYAKGQQVSIEYFPMHKSQYMITFSAHDQAAQNLYVRFKQSKIGTSPPYVIFSIFLSGVLISVLASYFLAHRFKRYFRPLIEASIKLSKGQSPEIISQQGPREIQLLTQTFNQMSEDVRELLQNRTTLLTGVSHNLRTPVTRLKLAMELLPEETDDGLKEKIHRSLDEMDATITQFLNMAQGMNVREVQTCNINRTIQGLINKLAFYGGSIHFAAEDEIVCDLTVSALEQILSNLLENALRYAGQQAIEILIHRNSSHIQIQVLDKGPGIPADIKDMIFQPFVSLQSKDSPVPGGTGLGLAICRIIASAHHWELSVDAREPVGTCASLSIPV